MRQNPEARRRNRNRARELTRHSSFTKQGGKKFFDLLCHAPGVQKVKTGDLESFSSRPPKIIIAPVRADVFSVTLRSSGGCQRFIVIVPQAALDKLISFLRDQLPAYSIENRVAGVLPAQP